MKHHAKKVAQLALLAFAALALLAACAPATAGGSVRSPLVLGQPLPEVTPGQTIYLVSVHTLRDLGFRDEHLEVVIFTSESGNRASGRATNWVDVTPVRVPPFWSVTHEGSRFVQTASGHDVLTTVEVTMRIDIPSDSPLGQQQLVVRIDGRGGGANVTIPLRVRQILR